MAKLFHVGDFSQRRRAAYPEIGDQLDQILKAVKNVPVLAAELAPLLERIDDIKRKYPKPEQDTNG